MAFAVIALQDPLYLAHPGQGAEILEEIIKKGFSASGSGGNHAMVVLDGDHQSEDDITAAVQRVLMATAEWPN